MKSSRKSAPRLQIVPDLRTPRAPRKSRRSGVVAQVRETFSVSNALPALLGTILGGIAPAASYEMVHHEIQSVYDFRNLLVGGLLIFSAKSVYLWLHEATGDWIKAVGLTVGIEGVLLASSTPWLSGVCLGILIAVNAIAMACHLARGAK